MLVSNRAVSCVICVCMYTCFRTELNSFLEQLYDRLAASFKECGRILGIEVHLSSDEDKEKLLLNQGYVLFLFKAV